MNNNEKKNNIENWYKPHNIGVHACQNFNIN
jgi:hypothetical protein